MQPGGFELRPLAPEGTLAHEAPNEVAKHGMP